jgi:ATP-dependent DNA helicase RecG
MAEGLDKPVQFLKGVGPRRAALLSRLELRTLGDLVYCFPSHYYDRRAMTPLSEVGRGAPPDRTAGPVTVQGVVTRIHSFLSARQKVPILEISLTDGESRATLVFYHQPFREKEFRIGDTVIATGKPQPGRAAVAVEEFEILGEGQEPLHAAGLVPSYPATAGLSKRQIRTLVRQALEESAPFLGEVLPEGLLARRGLLPLKEALRRIHAPATPEEAERARRRFAYEEFFLLQARLALKRRSRASRKAGHRLVVTDALDFRIRTLFPFKLTGAQDRAVRQIRKDLAAGPPMNRLLQGDVGSGKTIVAAYALLAAIGKRTQAALLAPTETLAEQHLRIFRQLLERSRVRIGFLGGGLRGPARARLLESVARGEVDLLIGTHALLGPDVAFKNLALVVVDEQQKFGVLQRSILPRKGDEPHLLVMTATPIPRTLALTLFGDLDVSVLDERPPGRREVSTIHVPPSARRDKLAFIRSALLEGRQAYFVYPLVDDSDKVALRSALKMHAELTREFHGFRVGLLHGRMKPEEKQDVMDEFRSGQIHVLVSTLVIEVGIDVPNASIMVVDHCDRYGLSQLHQLRGRIGRGPHPSVCLLLGQRNERIDALVATQDGFKIAEADLRIRGPGELLGTRQSGLPLFRAARLAQDAALLDRAREDAFGLVERDPRLSGEPALREALRQAERGSLLHVG